MTKYTPTLLTGGNTITIIKNITDHHSLLSHSGPLLILYYSITVTALPTEVQIQHHRFTALQMQHHSHCIPYCITNSASHALQALLYYECHITVLLYYKYSTTVLLYYKCSTVNAFFYYIFPMQHHSFTVLQMQHSHCIPSCQTNAASQSFSQNESSVIIPLCTFHLTTKPLSFSPTHIHLQGFLLHCRRFVEPPADHHKEYGDDLDAHREEEDYKYSITVIALDTVLHMQHHCHYTP